MPPDRPQPRTRLDAQRFLLTYSQVDVETLTPHALRDFLINKDPSPLWLEIATENHEDGGKHYHVALWFPSAYRGNYASFDVAGYHPNIQKVGRSKKDERRVRLYIRKEDTDLIQHGEVPPIPESTERDSWGDILNAATSAPDFMDRLRDQYPEDYVKRYFDLFAFAQHHWSRPDSYVAEWPTAAYIRIPAAIHEWIGASFDDPRPPRPKTLMVVGPTRIGKTEWARSLGRHIYMCGLWDLSLWDNDAEYLIIDDISFEYWQGGRKTLWGSQKQVTLTDKFARKKTVAWGKPLIYLCNSDQDWRYLRAGRSRDRLLLTPEEIDYYEQNSVIVELPNIKLWEPLPA